MSADNPDFGIETEYSQPIWLHDLLELSDEETTALKERIEKHHGIIWLVVHPFYKLKDSERPRTEQLDIAQFVTSSLKRPEENTPAMVFMEEEGNTDNLNLISGCAKSGKNNCYCFHTYKDAGVPKFRGDLDSFDEDVISKNWLIIRQLFDNLGVKKVVIMGIAIGVHPLSSDQARLDTSTSAYREQRKLKGALDTMYVPEGCAGTAARMLAESFEVEISNMTFGKNIIEEYENIE